MKRVGKKGVLMALIIMVIVILIMLLIGLFLLNKDKEEQTTKLANNNIEDEDIEDEDIEDEDIEDEDIEDEDIEDEDIEDEDIEDEDIEDEDDKSINVILKERISNFLWLVDLNNKEYLIEISDDTVIADEVEVGDILNVTCSSNIQKGYSELKFEENVKYVEVEENNENAEYMLKRILGARCIIVGRAKDIDSESIVFIDEGTIIEGDGLSIGDYFYVECEIVSSGENRYDYLTDVQIIKKAE